MATTKTHIVARAMIPSAVYDYDAYGDNDNDDDCDAVVGWLLNVPATCECISGTDLHRQFYVLPH